MGSGADVDLKEFNEKIEKLEEAIIKKIEDKGNENNDNMDRLYKKLDIFEKANMSMMRALVSGSEFAPSMMLFVPQKEKKLEGIKPSNWFSNKVKVMFICPVTMRVPNDSNDDPLHYIIELPKDWVKRFGPTILVSLNILKFACGAGKITGFAPLVIAENVRKFIPDNSSTLTSMYDELKKLPELESTYTFIEKTWEDPDILNRTKPVEGTHGAIAVSKLFKSPDVKFERSGLVLAADMYGKCQYIDKKIKLVFEKHGFKACLKMKTEDLHEKNRELLLEAKKEEDEYECLFSKIKENNEVVDNSDILVKGYMQNKAIKEKKIKNVFSRFNERYFILKRDGILLYYTSENDAEIGISAIYGHKLLKKVERVSGTNEMKFEFANSNDALSIIQRFRILPNQKDNCDKWVKAAKQITCAKTTKN